MAKRHGQAAMEYLVTYGWALLALFLVVALLISSGAFSPSSFSSQECTFQPDLPCSAFILYRDNSIDPPATTLRFTLTNGLGFPINISNVTYTASDLGLEGRQDYNDTAFLPMILGSGGRMNFTYAFQGGRQPQPRAFKTVLVSLSFQNCKDYDAVSRTGACAAKPYYTSGRVSAVVEEVRG